MAWRLVSAPVGGKLLALGLVVLLLGSAPRGQQPAAPSSSIQPDRQIPPVTFKVEINYVEVDASVVNQQGDFVPDLAKEDFEVLENGKKQEISAFSLVDIPVERPEQLLFAPRPVEPDVQTNARPFDGRLYVLVLDDLHTAPLRSALVRKAAQQFIERQMGANDLMAVVHTSGRTDASQEFTSNRRLLVGAVDKFVGRKLRSSTLNKLETYSFDPTDPFDPEAYERGYNARMALDAVKNLADWMASIHNRRKAIIFLSEGIDYDITNVFENRDASTIMQSSRDVIGAATRGNVNVYSVDPRGLAGVSDEALEISSPVPDASLRLGPEGLADEFRLAQDSLRVLADETGGFAILNSNDFTSAFTRIKQDNSSYYMLGYYSSDSRRDGNYRKLEVRVRRPGLEVRARKGYVAPTGKAPSAKPADTNSESSSEVRNALESPLPVSGFTMSASAAPFKGTAPNASVVVTVQGDGRNLAFKEQNGKFTDLVEVSLMAVDASGKVKGGDHHKLSMTLRPETQALISKLGFRVVSRLDLPPGRFQIPDCGEGLGRRQRRVAALRPGRPRLPRRPVFHERPHHHVIAGLAGDDAQAGRGTAEDPADAPDDGADVRPGRRAYGARGGVRQPGQLAPHRGHHNHRAGR